METILHKFLHYKNCIVDSKENYKLDLGVKGLRKI